MTTTFFLLPYDGACPTTLVAKLAIKYGFDVDKANRFLNQGELKIVYPSSKKETGNAPKTKPKTKRPKTGYLLFCDSERPVAKESLMAALEGGTKLKSQAVITELGARWKALSEEERNSWKALAKMTVTSDETATKPLTRVVDLAPLEIEGSQHQRPPSPGSVPLVVN
jgi:hypothetical protein